MLKISEYTIPELPHDAPKPQGWKLLCSVPKVSDKVGSVYIPDSEVEREQHAVLVLYVHTLGPDAYVDVVKFPSGPRCQAGDYVMIRSYSGERLKIGGDEYRLINDDQVIATVPNPSIVTRSF